MVFVLWKKLKIIELFMFNLLLSKWAREGEGERESESKFDDDK